MGYRIVFDCTEDGTDQSFSHYHEHTGTSVTDYRFTDQEYDGSSGLYNYDARKYLNGDYPQRFY